ncbi:MAG: ATP-binding cassette domain-containing protein [Tindallia sp. MSAO_Bac2]|nr:MAG: ATP-binding cassette domain-containing protein [Tindallia sp. MSAO_Bac2]
MMTAIETIGLSYVYPDTTPAFKEVNLQIKAGAKTAILGINGSGKTTLIYHLNGIIPAQQGEVKIQGLTVDKKHMQEVRKKVGLLFDNPDDQLFSTTIFNDIAFGPRNLKLDPATVNQRVKEALDRVDMAELAQRPPYCLSLGQKKRAAIAGLLAMKPQVLAFDEPFSGLDPEAAVHFRNILDQLVDEGATLVYSTHDVDMAYGWADEVIMMKSGKVLACGEYDLLRDEALLREASLPMPALAKLFKNHEEKPRTVEEAQAIIEGTKLLSQHQIIRLDIEK